MSTWKLEAPTEEQIRRAEELGREYQETNFVRKCVICEKEMPHRILKWHPEKPDIALVWCRECKRPFMLRKENVKGYDKEYIRKHLGRLSQREIILRAINEYYR